MEPQTFQKPCSTASKPPEDSFISDGHRFIPAANHHQTPLMTNSDQSIESAFSSLSLSSDVRFRSQATSSRSHPAAVDDGIAASPVSIPPPMAFGGRQQALIWAQSQITNASINGPFAIPGPHQRISVGPGFAARGPYLHAGDNNQLMKYNQRQDFYGANSENFGRYVLHGKEPILINPRYNVPLQPLAWENNSSSSWNSSSYTDQQLYKPRPQHLTFEDMRGGIVSWAKDQVLSEILNLKLEEGLSENEIDMILSELMECWSDLLRNQFGSQFVQKLFALCNEDQRTRIVVALIESPYNLVTICLNSFGARAIQKLLEKLNTPQQISLVVDALKRGALALATDPNGQNVIHYCLKRFPGEYTKCILIEIAKNCYRIATNKSGCCVLQSCVENSRGDVREQLISEIIANAVHLAEDPYGNYVVQHLLGLRMQEVTKYLLQRFQGRFLHLSCNKYASNVVEKMLESGEECCTTILLELLSNPNASMLLLDPFGNFVIQSALSSSKGEAFELLYNLITLNAQSMQSNLYGKKVLAWFEKKNLY